MQVFTKEIVAEIYTFQELKELAKIADTLYTLPRIYISGTFRNRKTGDLAFCNGSFERVLDIGYKYITMEIDGHSGEYTMSSEFNDGGFRIKITKGE